MELRYYQREALDALYNYYADGNVGNALIGLPTGTGKSVLPAAFIKALMQDYPYLRSMIVTHVKELVQQNYDTMLSIWPEAPAGIYSSGLNSKDSAQQIIFGGIQSMIKCPQLFGHRDLAFVDEAHLVSGEENSQYQKFFTHLKLINPKLKIVGMSATLYRMAMGMITQNGIFTDIVYDKTSMEGFNELLAAGYMVPLVPFRTSVELDISNVEIARGEFVQTQLQGAVDKAHITYKACQEIVNAGTNRKSWLIFASGIEHAEHIAEQLGAFGVDCAPVHSKRPADYNDAAIAAFKSYELRAIVNYGKLTTGFNHPGIDLIAVLRPTISVPLWVQMLGRGTRPEDDKKNCVVLDFAKNSMRLGPINDPKIPHKKGTKEGELPIKICEACGCYNHPRVTNCINCGAAFSFQIKITSKSSADALLRQIEDPIIETFPVTHVFYAKHQSRDETKPPTLKTTYVTNSLSYQEYICLQHKGMAGKMAREWWRKRHQTEPPATIDEALLHISELRCPRFIKVHVNQQWPRVVGAEF